MRYWRHLIHLLNYHFDINPLVAVFFQVKQFWFLSKSLKKNLYMYSSTKQWRGGSGDVTGVL